MTRRHHPEHSLIGRYFIGVCPLKVQIGAQKLFLVLRSKNYFCTMKNKQACWRLWACMQAKGVPVRVFFAGQDAAHIFLWPTKKPLRFHPQRQEKKLKKAALFERASA